MAPLPPESTGWKILRVLVAIGSVAVIAGLISLIILAAYLGIHFGS
jgi:hypothetical protein